MNRGKELAKNTAIIAIGKVSTQFISFFLLPLYTAMLSTEEYGTVEVFNTCVALLLPVMTLQIEQGVFRFLVDARGEKKDQQELITNAISFILIQCAVCFFAFVIVSPLIHIDNKIYILINMIANSLSMTLLQIARGVGSNAAYSVGSFLTAVSSIILNVLFIVGLRMGAEGMLLATFLGNLICCFYLVFRLKVYSFCKIKYLNRDILKKLLRYSLPLVPNAVSWWLVNASDRLVVAGILGLEANGILSVAHKFPSVYASIYNIVNMTWVESATMYMNKEGGEEYFDNMINVLQKLFTSAFLGCVAVMPFVFSFLVNEAYQDAYGLIPIYMLASAVNATVALISVVYTVDMATKEIAKTTIFAGVINIIVLIALIFVVGIYAAPISSAVAYLLMAVYRYFDGQKHYKFKFDPVFLVSAIVMFIFICVGYYSQSTVLHVGVLLITVIYCIYFNKKVLFDVKNIIGELIKRIQGRNL